MIRIINRRLIIPKGDTGSFSLPNLSCGIDPMAIAVLTIYDPLYRTIVLEKIINANEKILQFHFAYEDTKDLEPREYRWDVKIYQNAIFDEDGFPIDGDSVNSYYGYLKELPKCIIKGGI